MKIILLLVAIMLLVAGGAEARYSPGLEIATGESITLAEGHIKNASTDEYQNIETFGAIGDNSTDCTDAIEAAMAAGGKILIPPGTFRCKKFYLPAGTGDNIIIAGCGPASNLAADLGAGEFLINTNSTVGGIILRDFDIIPYGSDYDCGGIMLDNVTRGATIQNVRVYSLQRAYNLTDSIWSSVRLINCGAYLSPLGNSTGLFTDGGAAIFAVGLEVVGYAQGVYLNNTNLVSIVGGNIAGSPGYTMNESIVISSSNGITVEDVWIEEITTTKYGAGKGRAIEITDSYDVELNGIRFSAGCLYMHSGKGILRNSAFYENNGDAGYGKITVLNGGSLATENVRFDVGSYGHSVISTGNISASGDPDKPHGSTGRFYLPLLNSNLIWIGETNGGLVDITYDTSDYLTGNKSANVTTLVAYQGIYFNATNLPKNTPCTVTAMVKTGTADAQIYITNVAATDTSEDYTGPGQSVKNAGNNWRRISSTLKTTTGRIDARIISTAAAVFKVDSINVYAGVVDYAPY